MPILRREIPAFAHTWNVHKIRRQRSRPHCPTGQPVMLYFYPEEAANYGLPVDHNLLERLRHETVHWGMSRCDVFLAQPLIFVFVDVDEYLPPETLTWCQRKLQGWGFDLENVDMDEYFPDGTRAHCRAYLRLRDTVRDHLRSGEPPRLRESEKPNVNLVWRQHPNPALIEELDLYAEGRDENEIEELRGVFSSVNDDSE